MSETYCRTHRSDSCSLVRAADRNALIGALDTVYPAMLDIDVVATDLSADSILQRDVLAAYGEIQPRRLCPASPPITATLSDLYAGAQANGGSGPEREDQPIVPKEGQADVASLRANYVESVTCLSDQEHRLTHGKGKSPDKGVVLTLCDENNFLSPEADLRAKANQSNRRIPSTVLPLHDDLRWVGAFGDQFSLILKCPLYWDCHVCYPNVMVRQNGPPGR